MSNKNIYTNQTALHTDQKTISGDYVKVDGERFYRIVNYDHMPPFFMSIVSDSDHWMFISSNGALTAGRINPDNALFPYYTDDRIHDSQEQTGSKTILLVTRQDKRHLWEPFCQRYAGLYDIERSIYKNIVGNKLVFEEVNHDLGLTFRYAWLNSEKFGFIKQSRLMNTSDAAIRIDVLDGMQNLLPYGIDRRFQLEYSTLADGYKKNELVEEAGLGIFRMSSIPTDKAEPSEALKATTVWSTGTDGSIKLLSSLQLDAFRKGRPVEQEEDIKGARGAYFCQFSVTLDSDAEKEWLFAADINQDSADVNNLINLLKTTDNLRSVVLKDVAAGTENLQRIIANADGLQLTADEPSAHRHSSNVLFNVMRGGIFDDGYRASKKDFITFIRKANKPLAQELAPFFESLPESLNFTELISLCSSQNNALLEKLAFEYMPLTFGRRHGDPSRPWNIFSIEIKDSNGDKILNYQGNWRDIFQNWEALALSFPDYIESMIAKFVNATTADGYNPYRVTRDGFEWEELDPDDAWSYIGYWGDHQIIYLLKLLELSVKYHPGKLQSLLTKKIYAYANVPYRIKSYGELLKDPQNTIDFDYDLDAQIKERVAQMGGDAKFIQDEQGRLIQVNLVEKLLVTLLAKLSNFIPEAGIWMNTQRPEWNDANNALVGNGVSMVTLYYIRRYLAFCAELFQRADVESATVSGKVAELLDSIRETFEKHIDLLAGSFSDEQRKQVLDELGTAGEAYRQAVYAFDFGGTKEISFSELANFCQLALKHVDHSIRANKRADNIYHAYNLIKIDENKISIRYLYEMLEGQVAVLSSGLLSPAESLKVLDTLRQSPLYREDQNSYILYPDRRLPRFIEMNNIPVDFVESSALLQALVQDHNRAIVVRDEQGQVHFNGDMRNGRFLKQAIESLKDSPYAELAEREKQTLLDLYEEMFDHQSFTGRSGTFFKYEGLGSIYWHMVSKLLLAVGDIYEQTVEQGQSSDTVARLAQHYYDIREGIGVHKSPELYGAFPTDPYSHTPAFAGAQQPGMTGQVKEDILSRYMEFGVSVQDGKVSFSGRLLKAAEFVNEAKTFGYYDVNNGACSLTVEPGCLVFTICQVPVVYHRSKDERLIVTLADGSTQQFSELILNQDFSRALFTRDGRIQRLDVFLSPQL